MNGLGEDNRKEDLQVSLSLHSVGKKVLEVTIHRIRNQPKIFRLDEILILSNHCNPKKVFCLIKIRSFSHLHLGEEHIKHITKWMGKKSTKFGNTKNGVLMFSVPAENNLRRK